MKDKDFYGSGKHPRAGESLIKWRGKWYGPLELQKIKNSMEPESLQRIKSNTLAAHTGFSSTKKIEESITDRESLMERLVLHQALESRLLSQLEKVRCVINSLKEDLEL